MYKAYNFSTQQKEQECRKSEKVQKHHKYCCGLRKGLFFSKNVTVASVLEEYPSSLFTTATLFQILRIFPMVFISRIFFAT